MPLPTFPAYLHGRQHLSKTDIGTIVSFPNINGVSGFQFTSPLAGETLDYISASAGSGRRSLRNRFAWTAS